MAENHRRKDYSPQGRPHEEPRSSHLGRPQDYSSRSGDAMTASVTLPSIHDHRGGGSSYATSAPPPGRGYPSDPRYASPNAVNGYPAPPGQHHQQPPPPGYLPPMQAQSDPRMAAYPPPEHGQYYEDRRGQQYPEQYPPQDPYFVRGPPHPGYHRDYRGPPPGHYPPDYAQGPHAAVPAAMSQAAPRQRTSIACRYCRKRKIRCSGYQSAPGGKCQNCSRMNQECVFQPVSSSSSTAFIPVSAVPGGVPPGTQLFGAYGQPLPSGPPQPQVQTYGGQPPHSYYQAPMQSPTESYSSYGESRGEDGSARRRRRSDEYEEGYRLPPPRSGPYEEENRRRSPAEGSNHSSPPGGHGYPTHGAARHSPRSVHAGSFTSSSVPGGRSPGARAGSSRASTPARHGAAPPPPPSTGQPQQGSASVMSLSNVVEKNDIDSSMKARLNRKS